MTVLITGASSGIGRATALRLAARGHDVVGGVRRIEDAPVHPRVAPVALDVTDGAQLEAVAQEIGPLRGVVNNAAITVPGPLEHLPIARLREQLETNVVGVVAVSQAFLPALRSGGGRLVMISSGAGHAAMPFWGAYSASKFAVEAVSDVFRQELRPSGVPVVVVSPGSVRTPGWAKVQEALAAERERMSPEGRRRYGRAMDAVAGFNERMEAGGVPPEKVATVVERALTDQRPRARYLTGAAALMTAVLRRALPTRGVDTVLGAMMGLPTRAVD